MAHERAPEPMDQEEARQIGQSIRDRRDLALKFLEECLRDLAEKKHAQRKRLAQAFMEATGDTAAQREANAKQLAADAELARDIAEGMVKVAQEKLNSIDGERATFHRLLEWSMALDPTIAEIHAQRMDARGSRA